MFKPKTERIKQLALKYPSRVNELDNFVLWSGDSDFADPIKQLLDDGRKVVLFATARKVSAELNILRNKGLYIFEIKKIRDFICWPRDI